MDFAKVDAFVVINSNKRDSVKWGLLSLFYHSEYREQFIETRSIEKVRFDLQIM